MLQSLHSPCEPGLRTQIVFLVSFHITFPDAQTPKQPFLTQASSSKLSDAWSMFTSII
eukprot:TRINITY_DN4981_c0_g1_i1.p2 TRINITY_DN4981_c0_g1~~TRINITY_DN4981_c0_g1_i1.p2  ORF type:complete len:58 (+),score=0.59 TRINITY_DN4981_c0_g1_i1:300-473(+)